MTYFRVFTYYARVFFVFVCEWLIVVNHDRKSKQQEFKTFHSEVPGNGTMNAS